MALHPTSPDRRPTVKRSPLWSAAVVSALLTMTSLHSSASAVSLDSGSFRGRIVAQSVTAPWVGGPRATQASPANPLFLATSRPCIRSQHYQDVTIMAARAADPNHQDLAQAAVGTKPWQVTPTETEELNNIATLTFSKAYWSVPTALSQSVLVPGQYDVELTCVDNAALGVTGVFVGTIHVNSAGWVDVNEVSKIAPRPVSLPMYRVPTPSNPPGGPDGMQLRLREPLRTFGSHFTEVSHVGSVVQRRTAIGSGLRSWSQVDVRDPFPRSEGNVQRTRYEPLNRPGFAPSMIRPTTQTITRPDVKLRDFAPCHVDVTLTSQQRGDARELRAVARTPQGQPYRGKVHLRYFLQVSGATYSPFDGSLDLETDSTGTATWSIPTRPGEEYATEALIFNSQGNGLWCNGYAADVFTHADELIAPTAPMGRPDVSVAEVDGKVRMTVAQRIPSWTGSARNTTSVTQTCYTVTAGGLSVPQIWQIFQGKPECVNTFGFAKADLPDQNTAIRFVSHNWSGGVNGVSETIVVNPYRLAVAQGIVH